MSSQQPIQRRNKRSGTCAVCSQNVPVGVGVVTRVSGGWRLTHSPKRWVGSPVSGRWVDGCPPSDAVAALRAVERGDAPSGSVVVKVTGSNSLHSPGGVAPGFETETRLRVARLHSAVAVSKARTGRPDSLVDYAVPEVVALSHMTVRELIADASAAALLTEIAEQEGWS
jgi:hypothetical protein